MAITIQSDYLAIDRGRVFRVINRRVKRQVVS